MESAYQATKDFFTDFTKMSREQAYNHLSRVYGDDKDDLGRDQLVGKMKQQNPAGFKKGGKVKKYRGRKAMGNKD